VLDRHLAGHAFLAAETYSIADIAVWAWYGQLALGRLYNAGTFLDVESYEHVLR
jgi:GST-like protein